MSKIDYERKDYKALAKEFGGIRLGKIPCASVGDCGKYLPKDYIKLNDPTPVDERQ